MVRRLQQGPARKEALLAAVYAAEGREAYGMTDGRALAKRFEADKRRLRDRLGVAVHYDAATGGYVLGRLDTPLLDLPDDDLRTLAWLADTFTADGPRAGEVRRLLDRLSGWLPESRQRLVSRAAGTLPTPDVRLRDSEPIAPDVWAAVTEASNSRRELMFDYRTSEEEHVRLRRHHVQPWDLDFTDRGHYRLLGYCLWCDGADGPIEPRDYRHYRLSRMVAGSARVLPRMLPPIRPRGRPRQVLFEMSPRIARFGVSARRELLDEPAITPAAGGWVRVAGQTLDVFDLARNLLYYGGHCRVLGGPELLAEMRGLAGELGKLYP